MNIPPDPIIPSVSQPQPKQDEGVVEKSTTWTWITDGVAKAAIRFVNPGEPRAREVSNKLAKLSSGDPACGDLIDLALSRLIEWGQIQASGQPTLLTPVAKKIAAYTSDEGTKAGVTQFLKVFLGELILHIGEEMVEEGEAFPDAASLMNAAAGRILETIFSQIEDLKEGTEEVIADQIVDDLFRMAFEKANVNWLVAFAGRHRLKPILKETIKETLTGYFSNMREMQELSHEIQGKEHFGEFGPTFATIHREIQSEIDRALFYLPGQFEVLLGEDGTPDRIHFLNQFATSLAYSQYEARQSLIHDLASVVLGSLFDPSQQVHSEAQQFAKDTLPFVLSELIASKEDISEYLDCFVITNESNEHYLRQLLVKKVLQQRKQKLIERGEEASRTAITLVTQQIQSLNEKVSQENLISLLAPIQGLDEVDWSGRLMAVLHEGDFQNRRKLLRDLGMSIIMVPASERFLRKVLEEKFHSRMSEDLYTKVSQVILGIGIPYVSRHLSNFSFDRNIAASQYLLEAEVARMNLVTMGAHDIVLNPLEEVLNLLFSKVEGLQFGHPLVDGILDALVKDQVVGSPGPFFKDVATIFVARTLENTEGGSFREKMESISSAISTEIEDAVRQIDSWKSESPEAKKIWFNEHRKIDYSFYLYAKHLDLQGEALHDAMIEYAAAKQLSSAILNVFTTKEDLEEILPLSFADFPVHELIVNQMTWQLSSYMHDIFEMAEAGMTFTAQVEDSRNYLITLEGEESKILQSIEALIQQASDKYSTGESTAARLVKALANENLLEKPALDMATVCVARAIQLGEGDSPSDKMASLLEKLGTPVMSVIDDFHNYVPESDESKAMVIHEMSKKMSEEIIGIFIDPEALSDRDRPVYDLIVDQLTSHIEPYFEEMQKYRDVRDLLDQLTDKKTLAEARQIIDDASGIELQEFMYSMLGEGLSLSKQQLKTGDEIVDDLIATAFETDWKGITADQLLENASLILTAQALKHAEGETFEEKMASISRKLSIVIEQAFSHYQQPNAMRMMIEGIFSIFIPPEEKDRPLYQYLMEQIVVNLAPTAGSLFDYYDLLRKQEPLPGEPPQLEQILLDLAFLGIEESGETSIQQTPQTFKDVAVKSLIPELEEVRRRAQKGEESALMDIFKGGIRLAGKGLAAQAPNFLRDPQFLRSGFVKIVSVAVDAHSREPTQDERELFGDMDRFSEVLSNRLDRIMFDDAIDPSAREAVKEMLHNQLREQLSLLEAGNELKRNQLIRDQFRIALQKSAKKSKKEAIVPLLRSRSKELTGLSKMEDQQRENEIVKGEIAALASELVLDQVEQKLSQQVPFAGFFAFVFSPLLSFLRSLLFFRLQWLMLKVLDSTSGEEGQIMMCRMIWETVGLFDPQEKVPEMEQKRLGKLRTFLSEMRNRPFELTSPFLMSPYLIKDDDSISQILERFHQNLHAQKTST